MSSLATMTCVRMALATASLTLATVTSVLCQEKSRCGNWQAAEPHLEMIRDGVCVTDGVPIRFTAVRFHLGHMRMRLLDTQETVEAGRVVQNGIAREEIDGRKRAEVLNYGIEGVLSRLEPKPLVITPAGWSRSQRAVAHVGLLRVDGRSVHPLSRREGMSAILCLHDAAEAKGRDYMVPILFYVDDQGKQNRRAQICRDAVQVGPRVIEEGGKLGIKKSEVNNPRYQRVVFAVDEPGREAQDFRSRDVARNGYLIVTHNPVHLYSLQNMLLNRAFYGGKYAPHWAVNLAGANLTGMAVSLGEEPELIGNTLALVGSVLIIERRPD